MAGCAGKLGLVSCAPQACDGSVRHQCAAAFFRKLWRIEYEVLAVIAQPRLSVSRGRKLVPTHTATALELLDEPPVIRTQALGDGIELHSLLIIQ